MATPISLLFYNASVDHCSVVLIQPRLIVHLLLSSCIIPPCITHNRNTIHSLCVRKCLSLCVHVIEKDWRTKLDTILQCHLATISCQTDCIVHGVTFICN
jgi:hypothetical protein